MGGWLLLLAAPLAAAQDTVRPPAAAGADAVRVAAPAGESGLPPLQRFSPRDYRAQPMNWAIAQDPRGVLYLGNADGVLEYDGQRWRLIRVANRTVVRSLAADASGRILVGAVGEIGVLQPDSSGTLRYLSLLGRLPTAMRDFADVWDTLATDRGEVFLTDRRLIRIGTAGIESWTTDSEFHRAFAVNGRVFVREAGRGLLELTDQLHPLPQGERFAEEKIYAMLPGPVDGADATAVLIGTRTQGLFKLDHRGLSAWPTAYDADLRRDLLYTGARTANGTLALGTLLGGVYLLDPAGRGAGRLEKANGLPDSGIVALANDHEGGLWITSDNGVARAEIGAPLTQFDDRNGLIGPGFSVHRHQGQLFVGTAQGLFRLQRGPTARFHRIDGIDGQVWALQSHGAALLIANYQGVYAIENEQLTLLRRGDAAYALHSSRTDPQRVLVGLRNGLAALRREADGWRDEGRVAGIEDEVRTLFEDAEGWLWLGTYSTGVARVRLAANADPAAPAAPLIERFSEADGLPDMNGDWVFPLRGEPRFATAKGIHRFDGARRRFQPDPDFADLFAAPRRVSTLQEGADGVLWMYTKDIDSGVEEAGRAVAQNNRRYRWESQALRAAVDRGGEGMQRIHVDDDGVVWLTGANGLLRHDPRPQRNYNRPFASLLRQVSGRNGRVLYGGSSASVPPDLAYADNMLRFEFAAPSFDGGGALQFQVRLEGSDRGWSAWSSEDYKDYNNLFEGAYRFRVRARNLYGTVSTEAAYPFRVLPPWYRTLWAYLGYLLGVGGLGWLTLRWRLRRLRGQKLAQQALVAERTRQLTTLGEVGRAITAQLDLDAALDTLYAQLNQMLDADGFRIGLYRPERGEIEFRLVVEHGERAHRDTLRIDDHSQLAVWCIEHRQALLIGDYPREVSRYLDVDPAPAESVLPGAERAPRARMLVPLLLKGEPIGVIAVHSSKAYAYDSSHLDILQTLAAYAATAIENARVISELALSHQNLMAAQQQLVMQEKMASLGQLVAGVAHEVNTPLGVALTASSHLEASTDAFRRELAQGALTRSALHRYVELAAEGAAMISRNLERAASLVQSFKQVSVDRSSDGRRAFKVQAFLDDLLRSLSSLWRNRPIEVSAECPPGIELEGFPGTLGQVLTILIQNALMHAFAEGQSGHLRISVEADEGDGVVLRCADDGRGIEAGLQARIFEPFFTTKRNEGGTGLGLHIAFNLVTQKLGGQIDVDSTPGAGTCFRLRLPHHAPR